jgi:hypothetical protein
MLMMVHDGLSRRLRRRTGEHKKGDEDTHGLMV